MIDYCWFVMDDSCLKIIPEVLNFFLALSPENFWIYFIPPTKRKILIKCKPEPSQGGEAGLPHMQDADGPRPEFACSHSGKECSA